MNKLSANPENCVWFYCQGWRWGKIVKRNSENRVTVQDCTGKKYRVKRNQDDKWVALSNKGFKGENDMRGKTDVKKKNRKNKGQRRFKIKITKRKFRKS
jgi:hypothetical protein